ncbi:transcription termination/antitermination protein NusA [Rickettsiales endosymbiont of Peranema trichophorum]|uniref:transcription termination factor NusA n=1 Tax=Rickettsiales endosymbiont of Peranema trichophorum TaxID=2486577 RepID=UPI001022FC9F|nr:transcription termination factor NusA [Rickettsiales endosymbiont of Peranema trichophorum]RZI47424.1 transcription termination/antitermination protein NusA [Rickettsiales endosymbiont of Peranema trichophorum]
MNTKYIGGTEILQIAEAVAREKSISREQIISVLEEAIQSAAKRKYGHERSIHVHIDRKSGEVSIASRVLVVEDPIQHQEQEDTEVEQGLSLVSLQEAQMKDPNIKLGDIVLEPLPPIDLMRVTASAAKHIITSRVREIESQRQYEEFKDRIGEIIVGVVEKIERLHILVKVGSIEAIIKKENLLKQDNFRQGDRVRALVLEVLQNAHGPQVILTRTHPSFLVKLFVQEVPELYEGLLEIKAVAREPGFRSKIAVFSSDTSIDPVGSCVGMRGARVQAITSELQGEKIDVIPWSSDVATLVISALAPAEVAKVIIDRDRQRIEAVVPEDQLSIAIGKRGQNVKLASKIVGWNLDVLTEDAESKRRGDEFKTITNKFIMALDVEETLAQLLASAGYVSVQDIADADMTNLGLLEGLDLGIAEELISRAKGYSATHEDASMVVLPDDPTLKMVDKQILELQGITHDVAVILYKRNVKTILQLADLSRDEFVEICPKSGLSDQDIDFIIMNARSIAYTNT